jgi:ribosome-interacting GTPase 1
MPANLTPIYKEAEERFKAARTDEERLACLVEMLSVLPKHKGTEKIQADLKTRISKLKKQSTGHAGGAKRSSWYQVERQGAGQVALFGPPNCGKSAIVAALTGAQTTVAAYPFSTTAPQAGMMPYEDIQIQLIDLPPVYDDAEPWVYHFLRVADLLLMVMDLADDDIIVSIEKFLPCLARANIRLRTEGDLPARPLLVIGNKADAPGSEERQGIAAELLGSDLPIMPVSAQTHIGLEDLRRTVFERLHIIRVYTKRPGHPADTHDPVILPAGSTVMNAAEHLHKDFSAHLRYAKCWDDQVHGQMVERSHVLKDKSIVEFHI